MVELLKKPSAFIPLLVSGGFLVPLLVGIAQGRLVRQPDEDTGAHLFQILMPAQLLIIAYFAVTWLPKRPRPALAVLALQAGAALAVVAIVYLWHL